MRTYQGILNRAVTQVVSGLKTPSRAIADAIYKQMGAGLKSTLIDKAGRRWSIDSYTRTVINTTSHQAYQDLRLHRAKDYDITTAVMSSHPASRYWCSFIQGKVVEMDKNKRGNGYPNIWDYEYKEPAGTQGINCHHRLTVFIPGVSDNHEQQYDPKEAQANMVTQQKQRALERSIRKNKAKLEVAKVLDDEPMVKQYKNTIRTQQSAMRQLIGQHDFLRRDYSREKNYGVGKNNYEDYKAESADLRNDYKKIMSKFGDKRPLSLQEFSELKYNDYSEYRVYKTIANSIKSNVATFDQKLAAIKAYNNFKKTDATLTDHAVEQYQNRLRKKNGQYIYNFQSVIINLKQPVNFIDINGRKIRYYNKLAVISEKDDSKVVTIMHTGRINKRWEKQ